MDASEITRRRQNKTIAGGFITRMNSNQPTYGASLGFSGDSIINYVKDGQMKNIVKCNGSFNVDNGCPCAEATITEPSIPCVGSYTASIFNNTTSGTSSGSFSKLIEVGSSIIGIMNTPYITAQTPAPVGVPLNLLKPINADTSPSPLLTVSSNTSRSYAIIVSYKKDGTLNWVTKIDTPTPESNIQVFISGIANDITGIYVTGFVGISSGTPTTGTQQLNFYNSVTSDLTTNVADKTLTMDSKYRNGFVAKYDFNGKIQWALKMQIPSTSSLTSSIIYATNNLIYCSVYISSNVVLSIYNSSNVVKSTLTAPINESYLALFAINQDGDIIWVDKLTFSGGGNFSNISIIYENNIVYLCFNTYSQTMNVYKTNPINPLADPIIIINTFNYNNMPPLPTTNGLKTIVLALIDNGGIEAIRDMYALKSNLTTNLTNNLNTQDMKLTDNYLVLGGWFTDKIMSISGNVREATPSGIINGALLMLNKDNFSEYLFYHPSGSENRVYDLTVNGNNIIACGLSNGTVTFRSDTLPDLQFTALGGNDAIIYSYDFINDNINWITNWQSPIFETAACILNSGSCYYVGGYIDGVTKFYTPDLVTRLPNTTPALTYTATARSPNLSIFTV